VFTHDPLELDASAHTRRLPARLVALSLGVGLLATVSGCGLFSSSDKTPTYTGSVVPAGSPRAGGQALAAQSASPGATPSGSAKAPSSSSTPYVEAIAKGACKPQTFVEQASLAGGSIHTYITKPMQVATPSQATVDQASKAAKYAAAALKSGASALQACPTAKALTGVTTQNVTSLQALSKALSSGKYQPFQVNAADALYADLLAQATRLKLTVVDKAPTAAQLAAVK